MGRYVGNEWHEELPSSGPGDQVQNSGIPAPNPAGIGQNAYGDDQFQTPNGVKTGTQITQELAAAGWDGQGDPVQVYIRTAGGGAAPSGPGTTTPAAAGKGTFTDEEAARIAKSIQDMSDAIAKGNREAMARAMHEFDLEFGLKRDQFGENIRQFNQNFGISQAGMTGSYQGAPTFPALTSYASQFGQWGVPTQGQQTLESQLQQAQMLGQYQGQQTLAAQNQYFQQGLQGVTLAAGLQANPFRQQQVLGQLGGLLGGGGVAGFQAPNTVAGVGTAGGNRRGGVGYLQQMIDDIRDPSANSASMNQVLEGIPTPNKINSNEFLRASPSTQGMVLQGMQEKYGLDPQDSMKQIQNTLPQYFQAPSLGGIRR